LMYLPIGLFGVSLATAVLPQVARQAAVGDHAAMRGTVSRGLALMLAVNVPAMVGLIVLADPITRLLFERGQFLASDTTATANALRFYAVGLVGYSAVRISAPVFYALGRNGVPVAVGFVSVAVNVIASLGLVTTLGFRGLALSTSIGALINGGALIWLLRGPLRGISGRHLLSTFVKSLVAAAVMGAVALAVERTATRMVGNERLISQIICLSAAIGAGLLSLAGAARILRIREFDEAFALTGGRVVRRLFR